MLAAVAAFAALGNWQLERAAEKRALAADFARSGPALPLPPPSVDPPRYQRVHARGSYHGAHQFLLDNQSRAGIAGVEVLTPLLLADGSAILVNRGWLPWSADRALLPDVPVRDDPRQLTGRYRGLPRAPVELAAPPQEGWPRLVNYPRHEELAAMLDRELRPGMILLDPDQPDGYDRAWSLTGTTPVRHMGYAVQWFALAATAAAIWLALSLKRRGETA